MNAGYERGERKFETRNNTAVTLTGGGVLTIEPVGQPASRLSAILSEQQMKELASGLMAKAGFPLCDGKTATPDLREPVICRTCHKPGGRLQTDGGLSCGNHHDECFEKMRRECRQRSW